MSFTDDDACEYTTTASWEGPSYASESIYEDDDLGLPRVPSNRQQQQSLKGNRAPSVSSVRRVDGEERENSYMLPQTGAPKEDLLRSDCVTARETSRQHRYQGKGDHATLHTELLSEKIPGQERSIFGMSPRAFGLYSLLMFFLVAALIYVFLLFRSRPALLLAGRRLQRSANDTAGAID